jgi:hypothetical protein
MNLDYVKNSCDTILSGSDLSPRQKLQEVSTLINKMYALRESTNSAADDRQDIFNLLTELSNRIRILVRESAWSGQEPISFKSAISKYNMPHQLLSELDDTKWDILETWIDHNRDYNWNYLNLVDLNLRFNWKNDNEFGLSPQHFRLYAILLTVIKQNKLEDVNQIDLNFIKNTYKSEQQIPMMIQRMLHKVHIHIQS